MSHADVSVDAFLPTIGNLNALIKHLAEKQLPLLGEQIRLRSFCASGVFSVVFRPSQIEDILIRLFIQAREEMRTGGMVLLQTSQTASHVVLTFRYTSHESDNVSTKDDSTDFGAVIQSVRNIVEGSRGSLAQERVSPRETLIRIYLPVARRFDFSYRRSAFGSATFSTSVQH